VAKLFNKDAALFFPSGTMANSNGYLNYHTPTCRTVTFATSIRIFIIYEGGGLALIVWFPAS